MNDIKNETELNTIKEDPSDSSVRFQTFISEYSSGYVKLTSGADHYIRTIIEENVLDRNFKFAVPYYADGDEKIFFSLPYIIADAIYKNTDIDTKDITLMSDNQAAIDWIPLLKGALDNYLKSFHYGEKLNEIRKELVDMGHVIVKEVDNESHVVNLLNVVRPPHIMDIQDGGIAERRIMTWQEMLENKEAWGKNWKKVEELKAVMDAVQKKSFIVYEWWTTDKFKVGKEEKETKGCIRFLDCTIYDEGISDTPEMWSPYVELERFVTPYEVKVESKSRLKRMIAAGILPKGATHEPVFPYEEQRLIPVPGRWMGMGIYELVRPETRAYNKTLNEKLRYDELLHKGVLVHTKAPFSLNQKGSGRGIESEIINRIQTGTMISIKAGEKIDRLNVGSLTADFIASADKWFDIARMKAGVNETAVGERLPSSTPATIGVLNERQAKTAFDVVNEQQGLFFERLFSRFKMKSIIDDITEEEWTKIIGNPDELARMEEAFIENLINVKIDEAAKTGLINPTSSSLPVEEMEKYKQAVTMLRSKQGGQRMAQFKKELINDFEFYAKFVITNEAFDKQVLLTNLQDAINTLVTMPVSGLDPTKLIERKLDLMGVSPVGLRKTEEQIAAEQMMAMQATGAVNVASPKGVQSTAKDFGEGSQMRV